MCLIVAGGLGFGVIINMRKMHGFPASAPA